MKVIERVRLPEALLLPPGAPLCATGGGCGVTLFEGNSGRLWLLAPAPRGGIKLATTGINLSDFLPANYRTEYDLCDFTNPRLVIGHNDNAYVLDLSTGRLVVRLQNFFHVFQSVCLTPDGNWLFGLNDSSLALYRLNHTASGEASPSVLLDVQA